MRAAAINLRALPEQLAPNDAELEPESAGWVFSRSWHHFAATANDRSQGSR